MQMDTKNDEVNGTVRDINSPHDEEDNFEGLQKFLSLPESNIKPILGRLQMNKTNTVEDTYDRSNSNITESIFPTALSVMS